MLKEPSVADTKQMLANELLALAHQINSPEAGGGVFAQRLAMMTTTSAEIHTGQAALHEMGITDDQILHGTVADDRQQSILQSGAQALDQITNDKATPPELAAELKKLSELAASGQPMDVVQQDRLNAAMAIANAYTHSDDKAVVQDSVLVANESLKHVQADAKQQQRSGQADTPATTAPVQPQPFQPAAPAQPVAPTAPHALAEADVALLGKDAQALDALQNAGQPGKVSAAEVTHLENIRRDTIAMLVRSGVSMDEVHKIESDARTNGRATPGQPQQEEAAAIAALDQARVNADDPAKSQAALKDVLAHLVTARADINAAQRQHAEAMGKVPAQGPQPQPAPPPQAPAAGGTIPKTVQFDANQPPLVLDLSTLPAGVKPEEVLLTLSTDNPPKAVPLLSTDQPNGAMFHLDPSAPGGARLLAQTRQGMIGITNGTFVITPERTAQNPNADQPEFPLVVARGQHYAQFMHSQAGKINEYNQAHSDQGQGQPPVQPGANAPQAPAAVIPAPAPVPAQPVVTMGPSVDGLTQLDAMVSQDPRRADRKAIDAKFADIMANNNAVLGQLAQQMANIGIKLPDEAAVKVMVDQADAAQAQAAQKANDPTKAPDAYREAHTDMASAIDYAQRNPTDVKALSQAAVQLMAANVHLREAEQAVDKSVDAAHPHKGGGLHASFSLGLPTVAIVAPAVIITPFQVGVAGGEYTPPVVYEAPIVFENRTRVDIHNYSYEANYSANVNVNLGGGNNGRGGNGGQGKHVEGSSPPPPSPTPPPREHHPTGPAAPAPHRGGGRGGHG